MWATGWLKPLALTLFIGLTNLAIVDRVSGMTSATSMLLYLLLTVAGVLALVSFAYVRAGTMKAVIAFILALSAATSWAYWLVTREYLDFFQFDTLYNVAQNFFDPFQAYPVLWWSPACFIFGLWAFLLPAKRTIHGGLGYGSVFGMIVVMIVILVFRSGEGTKGLPAQLTPIAYLSVIWSEKLANRHTIRYPQVIDKRRDLSWHGDVVLIVDESIRGDFLSLNNSSGVPVSQAIRDHWVNFGLVSAISNCSDSTNVGLRKGVRPDSYLEDTYEQATVWQFAKQAGYQTVYLDGQLQNGRLGNHMTEKELQAIDVFTQVNSEHGRALHEVDLQLMTWLEEHLHNNVREFIYVNKVGAHFPYEGKYPKHARHYQPTMEDQNFRRAYAEPGEISWPVDSDVEERQRFVNSYKNALSWSVNASLDRLSATSPTMPFVVFYTSDHGQTFHDDGRAGYGTHCSIEVTDAEEGIVPLMVLTNDATLRSQLSQSSKMLFNQVSQFQLTPTLYHLMGYQTANGHPLYFPLLNNKSANYPYFLTKYFVRFGADPIWKNVHGVDLESVNHWAQF